MFEINNTSIIEASTYINLSNVGISEESLPFLRFYNILVLLVGILGNTLVLSGLLDHKVMKIDVISRLLLQNLAVADIFYTLFQFLPSLTTLFARRWVFGINMCLVQQIAATVFAVNEIRVVMLLSCYRLWFVHQPSLLGSSTMTKVVHVRWALVGLFCHDVVVHVAYHMTGDTITSYELQTLSCNVRTSKYILKTALSLYFIVVPILMTLVANAITICAILRFCTQKKNTNRPYRKATLTILTISIAFLISYTPFLIQMFIPGKMPTWYRLTSMYFLTVNIVCNPFIYAIFDSGFIVYIKDLCIAALYNVLVCYDYTIDQCQGTLHYGEEGSTFYSFEMMNFSELRALNEARQAQMVERV